MNTSDRLRELVLPLNWLPSEGQSPAGGVQYFVLPLARFARAMGVEVTIVCAGERGYREGIEILPVTHSLRSNFVFDLWLVFLAPMFRGANVVHAQSPADLFPFILSGQRLVRICTLHGEYEPVVRLLYGRFVAALYRVVEAVALYLATYITAVSAEVAESFSRKYPWLRRRIMVTSPGVDTSVFCPMSQEYARGILGLPLEGKVLLYVGRLEREKNIGMLLESASNPLLMGVQLIIVGEGRDQPRLEQIANSAGLSNVTFTGPVRHSSISIYLCASDVLVLCSTTEGSPNVIKEAICCGVPIVSTDVGDVLAVTRRVPELPAEIGEFDTPIKLAIAIAKVLSHPPFDRKEVGDRARRLFSSENTQRQLVGLYSSLMLQTSQSSGE